MKIRCDKSIYHQSIMVPAKTDVLQGLELHARLPLTVRVWCIAPRSRGGEQFVTGCSSSELLPPHRIPQSRLSTPFPPSSSSLRWSIASHRAARRRLRRSSHFAPNGRRSQWSCKLNGCVAWWARAQGRVLSNMEGDTPTHVVTWVSFMRRVNLGAIFYREPELLHLALSEGAVPIGKDHG